MKSVPAKRTCTRVLRITVFAILAAVLLKRAGLMGTMDRCALSAFFQLRESRYFGGRGSFPSSAIRVVAIDERSVAEHGVWPWTRKTLADLVRNVTSDGARVVGVDMILSERSAFGEGDDRALADELSKAGNVILPFVVMNPMDKQGLAAGEPRLTYPTEVLRNAARGFGYANVFADYLTQSSLVIRGADGFLFSFPLAVFAEYVGDEIRLDSGVIVTGARYSHMTWDEPVWINYFPQRYFTDFGLEVSACDVLKKSFPAGTFKGCMVLIGRTDVASKDDFGTPAGPMAGVRVFANVLNTLMKGKFQRESGPAANGLVLMVLAVLTSVAALRLRVVWSGLLVIAGAAVLFCVSAWLFGRMNHLVDFPFLVSGMAISYGLTLSQALFLREHEVDALGIYVSPEVKRKLINSPKAMTTTGDRKELTVLFADIRGFTPLSQELDPEETVAMLNEYFDAMAQEITRNGVDGTIDKLMGDAVMAFFGDPLEYPDHAKRAARAAVAMCRRFEGLRDEWQTRGRKVELGGTLIHIGIDVATGPVVVGNVGSSSVRFMDYTVIGDPANLASRLQAIAAHGQILVSEQTKKHLADAVDVRSIGMKAIKGFDRPVEVFEVLSEHETGTHKIVETGT